MRALQWIVVLLFLLPAFAAPSAAQQLEYEYALAPTVAVPGFRTNMALCDDPDDTCVGGVLFEVTARSVVAHPEDDVLGADTGLMLCVWAPPAESCHSGAEMSGPDCGTRELPKVDRDAQQGVVFLYGVLVTEDIRVCGATRGTLQIEMG